MYLAVINKTNCLDLARLVGVYMIPHKLDGSVKAWLGCAGPGALEDTVCSSYNETISIYHRVSQIYTRCR